MTRQIKRCRGHFHFPGTQLPLNQFYVHKGKWHKGRPFSECKRCWAWRRTHPRVIGRDWTDRIPVADAWPVISEVRRRLGPVEAARRAGLNADYLTLQRLKEQWGIRLGTLKKLIEVRNEARVNGEDNFDAKSVSSKNLIPGGPPGARTKANRVWLRMRLEGLRKKGTPHTTPEYHLMKLYPVKSSDPDPEWWHYTGQEWVPRYGEEMLGSDF